MQLDRVDLYEYFGLQRPENCGGYLNVCLHAASRYYPTRIRPAMLTVAGGGYSGVCEREGEPVAMAFLGKGYQVFDMEYSVAPLCYPVQLIEGAMAIAYIKENHEALRVDPDHVGAVGFSAGGHFVGMLATLTEEPAVKAALKEKAHLAKPDAVILSYPVITAGEFAHEGSIQNISGGDPKLGEFLSLEKRVTESSVPAFIWTTADDALVPSENAMLYALACKKHGVPFALHVYESGHHGLGLANKATATPLGRVLESTVEEYIRPDVETWFGLCCTWLESHGFDIQD